MLNKQFTIFLIVLGILVILIHSTIWMVEESNNKAPVKVGEIRELSFDFDNPDPFRGVDTVKVVAVKSGYVQFELVSGKGSGKGLVTSATLKAFNTITRRIK